MKNNKFGELIYDEHDLCDAVMRGQDVTQWQDVIVDQSVDLAKLMHTLELDLTNWRGPCDDALSVQDFDHAHQNQWHMPARYRELDIAEHVLSLCRDDTELQRAGQELMMFHERGLFDLLRYLVYLVDVMRANGIVWGVGRGSSVASFVLYLLGVHRINSIFYDLDPTQFLR
jgi:DNA polymerase III alpha subunit